MGAAIAAKPPLPATGFKQLLARFVQPHLVYAPMVLVMAIVLYMVNLREAHFSTTLQLAAGWGCLGILYLMYWIPGSRQVPWRFVFLVVSLYLAVRYMWWRAFETLIYTDPIDFIGMALLFLAEVYSLAVHFLQLFVNFWPLTRAPAPLPADRSLWPTVDIFIPTYTEDPDIVSLTALAATQIDYPREKVKIFILDDGGTMARRNDPAKSTAAWERRFRLKNKARELGIDYLTRESNRSAKAGNINHALQHSTGDLILFLDCDHVPTSDILRETVGHFLEDEKLFLVQTPHFFCNAAPTERGIGGDSPVPDESEMFYRVIHPGLDFWNASYFCGSAALMRRRCLEEIGGLSGTSITEDAETAFELHRRGYRSRYVNKPMVCGLAAEAYSDYMLQHTRWAQGSVQIMLLHNPLLARGLTLAQRLCYLNICLFWFFGLARMIYFIAPAGFLIFGMSIYHASAAQIMAYSLPHVLATFLITGFLFGGTRRPFFSEIYESIQSVFLTPATLDTVRHPHKPTFRVTPKGMGLQSEQLNVLSFFFFGIFALNTVAVVAGAMRFWAQPNFRDVVAVTLIWSLYNIVLAVWSLGALWEKRQARKHHRLIVSGQAMVRFPRLNKRFQVDLLDLSLGGVSFNLPPDIHLVERERIIVEAASPDGLVSYFDAVAVQTFNRRSCKACGAQFLVPAQSMPDVVHYVYGDSARWSLVLDIRARGGAVRQAMWQLMRMGLRGAWVCLTFLLGFAWNWLRGILKMRPVRAKGNA
jgi:cellulose synthase (UDP-forming)